MNLSESVICSKCLLEFDYLTFSKYNKIILSESNLALCSGPIQNTHTNFCKIAKRSWSYLTTSRVIFVKGNAITSDINCFTAIKWRQAASYPFYLFSWFSSYFLCLSPVSFPSTPALHHHRHILFPVFVTDYQLLSLLSWFLHCVSTPAPHPLVSLTCI